jgi:RsiW-degrading membrane proteinase PrsW (M82 family)
MKSVWLRFLFVGVVLFALSDFVLQGTNNPNFFPTVIMLGAFVVPVTFVTYFYEHIRDRDIPLGLLGECFIVGGTIGLIAAGFIEYDFISSASVSGLVGVGLIEESAKLILPVALFIGWRYRHRADGLLFGVAVGMGFAALETMGYSLVSLVQSNGDITMMNDTLFVRGLLSPAGHGAWTGIMYAVLWAERQKAGHININFAVAGAFVLVVLFHAAWDIVGSQSSSAVTYGGMLIVGIASLAILIAQYRRARKIPAVPLAAENISTQ